MEVKLEIPDYNPDFGMQYCWEKGFEVEIRHENNTIFINSNKAGLISLANHLLNLAQDKVPSGFHLHFDEYNSLEEGSIDLIVQKK